MSDIREFIMNTVFNYRIKLAFEPSEKQLNEINDLLTTKYKSTEVLPIVKTIFQHKPLDFANLDAGEIWMIDFVTSRGIVDDQFCVELGKMLGCSKAYIRLRNKDDMYQSMLPDENILELDEYEPLLSTDPHFKNVKEVDVDEIAGEARVEASVDHALKKFHEGAGGYSKFLAANFNGE